MCGLGVQYEVLRRGRKRLSAPSEPSSRSGPSDLRLHEKLLRAFTGDVLGVGLVAEMEVLAVFLCDPLHFLVSVRLFSSVEESGGYRQDGYNHKDDNSYDTCEAEEAFKSASRWMKNSLTHH